MKNEVPFLDLSLQHCELMGEIETAIKQIFADSSFVLDKHVDEFEQSFAEYCGARYCVSVHNGTAALHLALLAMGLEPGDEVITAANTFIATTEAISFCGATPVLVDCFADTANIDVGKIEAAITKRTKVIIPVHLYGQPAEMHAVLALAAKHGLKVLEDSSQAHGASIDGKRTGSFGDAAAFSFYPGKNLGAAGEGGAVVTSNAEIYEKVRLLRNHGSVKKYHHEIIGHNFRLDSIQAAILQIKLPHLDRWNSERQTLAARYNERLKAHPELTAIETRPNMQSVYHLYVVKAKRRANIEAALSRAGIGYGIHYPVPIHLQPAYSGLNLPVGSYGVSEALARQIISLPIYPGMTVEDQDRVLQALENDN